VSMSSTSAEGRGSHLPASSELLAAIRARAGVHGPAGAPIAAAGSRGRIPRRQEKVEGRRRDWRGLAGGGVFRPLVSWLVGFGCASASFFWSGRCCAGAGDGSELQIYKSIIQPYL
jgi:hypothetical protein